MSEVKKINAGAALTVPLALANRGTQIVTENLQKYAVADKLSAAKDHPGIGKITAMSNVLWTVVGLALIFHGAQFKNLFLCTQVVVGFCYGRMKSSTLSLYNDVMTAWEKTNEGEDEDSKADAKAEAKSESKHAQKRAAKKDDGKSAAEQNEEAAAATKKVLKVLDSEKVTGVAFEFFVAFMACHMVMEGGIAKVVVVSNALVKVAREKINMLLEFTGHEDMQAWTDALVSFVLYVLFVGMAAVAAPLAFALNIAACGAQLVTENSLRIAESRGKIPGGVSAEAFAASTQGLALLAGLTAFGTLWQVWAIVADSGMAWYFKLAYLPAVVAESLVSFF